MKFYYTLKTKPSVPSAASVAVALHEAGHQATVIEIRHSLYTATVSEPAIAPNGTRIFIDVSEDLNTDSDIVKGRVKVVRRHIA